jgi:hypothetical protein
MDRRTFVVVAFVLASFATGGSAQGPPAFPGSGTAGSMSSETREREIRGQSAKGPLPVIDKPQIPYRLEVDWSVDDKGLDPDRDPITLSAPQHPCSNPAHRSHADCGPAGNVHRDCGPRIRRMTHGVSGVVNEVTEADSQLNRRTWIQIGSPG